jgi:hypothetical protein
MPELDPVRDSTSSDELAPPEDEPAIGSTPLAPAASSPESPADDAAVVAYHETGAESVPAPDALNGDATPPEHTPQPPYSTRRPLLGAMLAGGALALLGAVFSWYQAVSQAIPSIVQPGEYLNYRELQDGVPVPHLLDWNLGYIQLMLALHDMHTVVRVVLAMILVLILWIVAVSVLNPTFKLFYLIPRPSAKGGGSTTPDISTAATAAVSAAHAETARSVTLLLLVGLPLALFWIIAGVIAGRLPGGHAETVARLLRLLSLGIATWVGFHRNGLAGDLGQAESRWSARNVSRLVAAGAAFGIVLFVIHRIAALTPLETVFNHLSVLGTFNRADLAWVTSRHVAAGALMWFAAGSALFALGRPGVATSYRAMLLALPAIATLLAAYVDRPLHISSMARTVDMTHAILGTTQRHEQSGRYFVPDGPGAGRALARLAHIPVGGMAEQRARNVLLFFPEGVYNVVQRGITEDGLPVARGTIAPVKAFLDKRHYRSSLSWLAIKHLYNVATVHFDPTDAIRWCLTDLHNYPHAAQINTTLRAMLFTCAATPDNLALLDQWADERQFAFPDRGSIRMMGDLYHRFGAVDKAMVWYRRADMPRSFMAERRAERPMFHTGTVQGRLLLNGRPLAGVQVGVVPQRLNGVPPDIAAILLRAAGRELVAAFPYSELFPAFHPRPYSFRWITAGATTTPDGRFQIDGLTEGAYILVCTLPPDVRVQVPTDRTVTITGASQGFVVDYGHPVQQVGDTRITVGQRQPSKIQFKKAGAQ